MSPSCALNHPGYPNKLFHQLDLFSIRKMGIMSPILSVSQCRQMDPVGF